MWLRKTESMNIFLSIGKISKKKFILILATDFRFYLLIFNLYVS